MIKKNILCVGVGIILLAGGAPAFCYAKELLGWVVSFSNAGGEAYIFRGDSKIEVRDLLELYESDVLVVTGADSSVDVSIFNSIIKVTEDQSPFKIENNGSSYVAINNIKRVVLRYFDMSKSGFSKAIGAVSRGRGIHFPLIPSGIARVKSRNEMLFSWEGGSPPYTVDIMDKDDLVVYENRNVMDVSLLVDTSSFDKGRYILKVIDASSSASFVMDFAGIPEGYCEASRSKGAYFSCLVEKDVDGDLLFEAVQ